MPGGPGCRGMIGNSYDFGLYGVDDEPKLHSNPGAWNFFYITDLGCCMWTTLSSLDSASLGRMRTCLRLHSYAVITHFFAEHPDYQPRLFYSTGESWLCWRVRSRVCSPYRIYNRGEGGETSWKALSVGATRRPRAHGPKKYP